MFYSFIEDNVTESKSKEDRLDKKRKKVEETLAKKSTSTKSTSKETKKTKNLKEKKEKKQAVESSSDESPAKDEKTDDEESDDDKEEIEEDEESEEEKTPPVKKRGRKPLIKVGDEFDIAETRASFAKYNITTSEQEKSQGEHVVAFMVDLLEKKKKNGKPLYSHEDVMMAVISAGLKKSEKAAPTIKNKLRTIKKFRLLGKDFAYETFTCGYSYLTRAASSVKTMDVKMVEYEVLEAYVNASSGKQQALAWLLLATGGRATNLIHLNGCQVILLEDGVIIFWCILKANSRGNVILAFYKYEWTMPPPAPVRAFLEDRRKNHPQDFILCEVNQKGAGPWSPKQVATTMANDSAKVIKKNAEQYPGNVNKLSVKYFRRHMDGLLRTMGVSDKELRTLMNHTAETSDTHYAGAQVFMAKNVADTKKLMEKKIKGLKDEKIPAKNTTSSSFPYNDAADMSFSDDDE